MSKTGKILLTIVGIAILGVLVIFFTDGGKQFMAAVINAPKPSINRRCTDTDGGMMPYTIWITMGLDAITHQHTQSHDYCLPGTNNWLVEYFCSYNQVVSQLVDCVNGCGGNICNRWWTGYGYGYGYGRGGQGTGYGYGYGYGKMDPYTKQPYIYLINVFKTYSKSIYDAAINKLWSFKMVNFYNKKEFSPGTSTE